MTRVGIFFGVHEVGPSENREMSIRVSPTLSQMQAIEDYFSHISFNVRLQHKITRKREKIRLVAILLVCLHLRFMKRWFSLDVDYLNDTG